MSRVLHPARHPARDVLTAIAAAALAAAQTGCHWPVPSCQDSEAHIESSVTHVVVDSDAIDSDAGNAADAIGFTADGVHYQGCRDYCATKTDVVEVHSCKPPTRANATSPAYTIVCNVHVMACTEATIMDMGSGRRPERFVRAIPRDGVGSPLAAYFATAAHLEAASVPAFARLAAELAHHRAPRALVVACRRAQRDEVRHARDVFALARRFGHRAPLPRVSAPRALRDLERIATENAIEGCVRETVGAAIAAVQAARATDPRVRTAMGRIARDEARHAALSWRIHAWALAILPADAAARVSAALEHAFTAIDPVALAPRSAALATVAGLPDAASIARLVAHLRADLPIDVGPRARAAA